MQKPESITITTFWLDWLLLPITFALGIYTFKWAVRDFRKAKREKRKLPFLSSFPLIIAGLSWLMLGPASLIRDEYYEHRVWCLGIAIWALSCLIGGILALISHKKTKSNIFAGLGLLLLSFILLYPATIDVPLGDNAVVFSHIWTVLMLICTFLLVKSELLKFRYLYVRLGIAIILLFLFASAALEIPGSQPMGPWFARLWDFKLSQDEFNSLLPISVIWQIDGVVKLVIGTGCCFLLYKNQKQGKGKEELDGISSKQ